MSPKLFKRSILQAGIPPVPESQVGVKSLTLNSHTHKSHLFKAVPSLSLWEGRNSPERPRALSNLWSCKRPLTKSYVPSAKGLFVLPVFTQYIYLMTWTICFCGGMQIGTKDWRANVTRAARVGSESPPPWGHKGEHNEKAVPGGPCPHKGVIIPPLGKGSWWQGWSDTGLCILQSY